VDSESSGETLGEGTGPKYPKVASQIQMIASGFGEAEERYQNRLSLRYLFSELTW
jgi:hypothetical protein